MTYRYKKTGFASALALGVAMMGLAGAASASSIHVLTSDGQVLLAKTATGTTKLVNTIRPLAGTEDPNNPNFSPNSLGFFDGTFYATSFMNDGDEIIYSFDAGTGLGNFTSIRLHQLATALLLAMPMPTALQSCRGMAIASTSI